MLQFARFPDGGVVAGGLLLGLRRLRQDPLGKVQLLAEVGKDPHHGGRVLLDDLVELGGQRVHA